MSYLGFFTFGGTEIINVGRTEAYARNGGLSGFRAVYKASDLYLAVGDTDYRNPLQDDECPWVDPESPESYAFYGLYPLDVVGIESSSRTSTTVEYNGNGGDPGRIRTGMKEIVFSGLLLADDDVSADYGAGWLRAALLAGQDGDCVGTGFDGATMCYFTGRPNVEGMTPADAFDCGSEMRRFLYRATVTAGPTITGKQDLPHGGTVWAVSFTVTVGNPFEYGGEQKIVTNMFYPGVDEPGVGGGDVDLDGYISPNVSCNPPTYAPITDPHCESLIMPPLVPNVALSCYTPPANWRRRSFSIPAIYSRRWTDTVPLLTVTTLSGKGEARDVRVRIWADDGGVFDPEDHPCAFCADILITYIPPDTRLTIDGRHETVMAYQRGQTRRADGLVISSDATPLEWPQLSCGINYLCTVDMLQTQKPPSVSFSLIPKVR